MSDLAGLTVVITRPAAQAEGLADLLVQYGASVIRYPVLEIAALDADALAINLDAAPIARADALIFVSANAVEFGVDAIRARGGFNAVQAVYAIGGATSEALRLREVANVQSPSPGSDSEALLAMPSLQNIAGRTVVIVRGQSEAGGRVLLQETLSARGAKVANFNCYLRRATTPARAARELLASARSPLIFSVLSVETLESLGENLRRDHREDACASGMMLVPHPRVGAAARKAGWSNVEIVPMAAAGMVDAILQLRPRILALATREIETRKLDQ